MTANPKADDPKADDPKADDRPIIFSAPMIRAILSGQKTQTRRIIKPQPGGPGPSHACCLGGNEWVFGNSTGTITKCPFGEIGTRLWVREGWALKVGPHPDHPQAYYRIDDDGMVHHAWLSPIHMPRWASRITLEITGVRVERVQEISEEDAKSEGVELTTAFEDAKKAHPFSPQKAAFAWLWKEIHGRDSWMENPHVWVIEFKRLTR